MSKQNHTPGPWSFDSEDGVYKEWPSGQLEMIAEIGPTYATTPLTDRANGQLIAAAPDLLAACWEALKQAKDGDEKLDRGCWPIVLDAICKATGESNE